MDKTTYTGNRQNGIPRNNKMGWLLACKTFGVSQAVLRKHLEASSRLGIGCWHISEMDQTFSEFCQNIYCK